MGAAAPSLGPTKRHASPADGPAQSSVGLQGAAGPCPSSVGSVDVQRLFHGAVMVGPAFMVLCTWVPPKYVDLFAK